MCWFAEPRQTRRVADDKFNGVFVLFWVFFPFCKAEQQSTAVCDRGERRAPGAVWTNETVKSVQGKLEGKDEGAMMAKQGGKKKK